MRIHLIHHTPEPLRTLYIAARTCYSPTGPLSIEETPRGKMESLILKVFSSGHESILEHVSFTFGIEGVSRVLTHQLVRHRIASFSQQSQRYVNIKEDAIVPPSIKRNKEAMALFQIGIDQVWKIYRELLGMGIKKEDARFILPNATATSLVMTMNLRELIHTTGLRLCFRAQWEIRILFAFIKREVKKVDRFIASLLQPRCIHLGYCPEEKTCGLQPLKREVIGDG